MLPVPFAFRDPGASDCWSRCFSRRLEAKLRDPAICGNVVVQLYVRVDVVQRRYAISNSETRGSPVNHVVPLDKEHDQVFGDKLMDG